MAFNIQHAQKKLKWLKLGNAFVWILTIGLFLFPLYQWWHLGHIPIDKTFAALLFANILLLVLSIKVARQVKFSSYQIRYFSTHEEN